jgi:hypothetical protein
MATAADFRSSKASLQLRLGVADAIQLGMRRKLTKAAPRTDAKLLSLINKLTPKMQSTIVPKIRLLVCAEDGDPEGCAAMCLERAATQPDYADVYIGAMKQACSAHPEAVASATEAFVDRTSATIRDMASGIKDVDCKEDYDQFCATVAIRSFVAESCSCLAKLPGRPGVDRLLHTTENSFFDRLQHHDYFTLETLIKCIASLTGGHMSPPAKKALQSADASKFPARFRFALEAYT